MMCLVEKSRPPPTFPNQHVSKHIKIFKPFQKTNSQTEYVYCDKDRNYINCSKKWKEWFKTNFQLILVNSEV